MGDESVEKISDFRMAVLWLAVAACTLTGSAQAEARPRDPWEGYETRDIRALRDESARAREQHERRISPAALDGASSRRPPVRPPALVSSARPPARPAGLGAVAALPAPVKWTGRALPGTPEMRGAWLRARLDGLRPGRTSWSGPALEVSIRR